MIRRFIMAAVLALVASHTPALADGTADIALVRAGGQKIPLTVELAVTQEEQETGLMHRTSLAQGHGMLFVYEQPERRVFWMKDTLIPLDILFFDKKAELVHLHPNATPESLDFIDPKTNDICAVLEIAGGEAARLGIKPGDKLAFKAQKSCK